MIRNVVLGRARADAVQSEIDAGLAGIASLRLPGQLSVAVGRDVGLRAAGWTFAITHDCADGRAHHGYDIDPEHNIYRDQIAALPVAHSYPSGGGSRARPSAARTRS